MALIYGDLATVTLVSEMGTTTGKTDPDPSTGTVVFDWPAGLLSIASPGGDRIFTPAPITATIDSTGQLKIGDEVGVVIPCTDDPDVVPTGWTYHVTHKISNDVGRADRQYDIAIPVALAGTIVNLADLAPVQPLAGFGEFVDLASFLALKAIVDELVAAGFTLTGEALFSKAGTIVVANGVSRYYSTHDQNIDNVVGSLGIPPTGSVPAIFDVRMNGTTIFTTSANRPTIVPGDNEDLTSVPDVTFFPQGSYITADIVQKGDGFAGSDANLQVELSPA